MADVQAAQATAGVPGMAGLLELAAAVQQVQQPGTAAADLTTLTALAPDLLAMGRCGHCKKILLHTYMEQLGVAASFPVLVMAHNRKPHQCSSLS